MHDLQYTSPSSSIYFSYVCISFGMIYKQLAFETCEINLSFDVLCAQNALLNKNSVAHIILTNVAYGIAPFRKTDSDGSDK